MQKYTLFTLVLIFALAGRVGFSACHAVGPSAAGDGSGSNWSNRMNNLPKTLVRGDTYYLADGEYGNYTFTTPNSGTTVITIKKAQSYDFGRAADGCDDACNIGQLIDLQINDAANGHNADPHRVTARLERVAIGRLGGDVDFRRRAAQLAGGCLARGAPRGSRARPVQGPSAPSRL